MHCLPLENCHWQSYWNSHCLSLSYGNWLCSFSYLSPHVFLCNILLLHFLVILLYLSRHILPFSIVQIVVQKTQTSLIHLYVQWQMFVRCLFVPQGQWASTTTVISMSPWIQSKYGPAGIVSHGIAMVPSGRKVPCPMNKNRHMSQKESRSRNNTTNHLLMV